MLQEEEKFGLGFGFVFSPVSLNSFFPSLPGEFLMRKAALSQGGHRTFADVLEQPILVVLNQKAPQDRCDMVL